MFHRGQLTMLVPAHAGKDYSKVLDTRRDSNEGLIAVEVMTRPVLLSRQHFLPVTESIAGGKDRLKKISNFRWPPQGLRSPGGNQIPACAGANDSTQNKLQKSLVLRRAHLDRGIYGIPTRRGSGLPPSGSTSNLSSTTT
jgi:hypothetical protein